MKISNNNSSSFSDFSMDSAAGFSPQDGLGVPGDLFERMEFVRQHEMNRAQNAEVEMDGAQRTGPMEAGKVDAEALDAAQVDAAQIAGGPNEELPLHNRVLEIACDALADKYASPAQAREQVLEAILNDRYGETLSAQDFEMARETLQTTLGNDPQFIGEVEQMLLAAARHLGRQDSAAS